MRKFVFTLALLCFAPALVHAISPDDLLESREKGTPFENFGEDEKASLIYERGQYSKANENNPNSEYIEKIEDIQKRLIEIEKEKSAEEIAEKVKEILANETIEENGNA